MQTAEGKKGRFTVENRLQIRAFITRLALVVFAALAATTLTASGKDIIPPDEPGPFNVGYTTFLTELSGGRVTQIRVFYPTFEAADGKTQYTIRAAAGTEMLSSSLLGIVSTAAAMLAATTGIQMENHGYGRGTTAGAHHQQRNDAAAPPNRMNAALPATDFPEFQGIGRLRMWRPAIVAMPSPNARTPHAAATISRRPGSARSSSRIARG